MDKTHHFDTLRTFTGSWEDYFILAALIVMALLAVVMFAERGKHQPNMHSPRLAWIRGGLYFCFAYIFSLDYRGVIDGCAFTARDTCRAPGTRLDCADVVLFCRCHMELLFLVATRNADAWA